MKFHISIFILSTLAVLSYQKPQYEMQHASTSNENYQEVCTFYSCLRQGAECQVVNGNPTCVCKTQCEQEGPYICGSDSKIYRSICHLDQEACNQGRYITPTFCTDPEIQSFSFCPHQPGKVVPEIPSMQVVDHFYVGPGQSLNISCEPTGMPAPRVHWRSEKKSLLDHRRRVYANNNVLYIQNANSHVAGIYYCQAINCATDPSVYIPTKTFQVHFDQDFVESVPRNFRQSCLENWWSHRNNSCKIDGSKRQAWVYDVFSRKCTAKIIDKCELLESSFKTRKECNRACRVECDIPVSRKRCQHQPNSVVYDPHRKICKQSRYSCGKNSFESVEDCENVCRERQQILDEENNIPSPFLSCPTNCEAPWKNGYCDSDFMVYGQILEMSINVFTVQVFRIIKDHQLLSLQMKLNAFTSFKMVLKNTKSCICPTYQSLKLMFDNNITHFYISGNYYKGKPYLGRFVIENSPLNNLRSEQMSKTYCYAIKNARRLTEESARLAGIRIGSQREFARLVELEDAKRMKRRNGQ